LAAPMIKIILLSLTALLGFVAGILFQPENSIQSLSIASTVDPLNKEWNDLPCPSESEFIALAQKLKMKSPEGPSLDSVCDLSDKHKLAKIFFFAKKIQIEAPQYWDSKIRSDLADLISYIEKNLNEVVIDKSLQNAYAEYKPKTRSVILSGQFFYDSPITALSTLVHEVRHSANESPSHRPCVTGNAIATQSGCDAQFSASFSNAGAYSYEVLFDSAAALYSSKISSSDKEFLLSEALSYLALRFNRLPEALALKSDVIVAQNSNRKYVVIHPFTFKEISIENLSEKKFNIQLQRSQYSPISGGAFFYTEKNEVYNWTIESGFSKLFLKSFPNFKSRLLNILLPPSQPGPVFTFVDEKNQLKIMQFDSILGKRVINDYRFFGNNSALSQSVRQEVKHFVLTLTNRTAFLTNSGKVYLARQWGNEDDFIVPPSLQAASNVWTSISAGLVNEKLYLIDQKGNLYTLEKKMGEPTAENDDGIFLDLQKSELTQLPEIALFQQGTAFDVYLSKKGELLKRNFATSQIQKMSSEKNYLDILVAQNTYNLFIPEAQQDENSVKNPCALLQRKVSPWMNEVIGIDKDNFLVFEHIENGRPFCQTLDPKRHHGLKINSFLFSAEAPTEELTDYSRTYLKLILENGSEVILRPYDKN
jgi:hypothetical protein